MKQPQKRQDLTPQIQDYWLIFVTSILKRQEAATGKGGFVDRFAEIKQKGGGYDAIQMARVNAYRDPKTGTIDAPGFGNSESRLRTDQERRMSALEAVLKRETGGAAPPPSGNIQPSMAPQAAPTPTPPAQTEPPKEESKKGTEIIIELGYDPAHTIAYHFIHTGTNVSKDKVDVTSFEGKSVRWLLTRVPQTNSFETMNLSQIANTFASDMGLKLEMEGKGQKYLHLDLTGKTPFELLNREAKNIGYRVADDKNKLILEPEARPKFTNFVVDEDVLFSAKFGDQARAGAGTPGTAVSKSDGAAGETKRAIDRQTGQTATLTPDSTAGTGKPAGNAGIVTGAAAPSVGGTVAQEAGKAASNPSSAAQNGTGGTPVKGPEFRKTERQEGNKKITEEVTIEKKEELPEKITTTTTTKTTEITITNNSGTKTFKTIVETKVATPTGTDITTKTTQNGATTENKTTNSDIDPALQKKPEEAKKPDVDNFGLPKQPAGIIDLEDGRAEGQAIADEAKRVKGYESTCVLLSTEEVLQIVPGEIIGFSSRIFPEPFDREWRVSEVRHDWAQGTTTINFYTPQKAPEGTLAPAPGQTVATDTPAGKLANPMPGTMRGTPFDPSGAIRGRPHRGIDLASGGGKHQLLAAESGTVTDVQTGCTVGDTGCGGGYGNLVEISLEGQWAGWTAFYGHLSSVSVSKNQKVQKGQVVGIEGDTGHLFGDHLHFELKKNGQCVDPEIYICPKPTGVYGEGANIPLKGTC
jgi:murein DD-endopeptidase MepM/ murein hydrolase activator NlpD